jgi:uncharacterized protein YkwD
MLRKMIRVTECIAALSASVLLTACAAGQTSDAGGDFSAQSETVAQSDYQAVRGDAQESQWSGAGTSAEVASQSATDSGSEQVSSDDGNTESAEMEPANAEDEFDENGNPVIGYHHAMEQEMYAAVNETRSEYGLNTLAWEDDMVVYSQRRAIEIIDNFSHESAGGEWNVGENLAKGYSSVDEVMEAWMNSPDHRANLLNPYYKSISISIYYNGYGYYMVQNFAL